MPRYIYIVVLLVVLVALSLALPMLLNDRANTILIAVMWLALLIDLKFVPSSVSLLRLVLPGLRAYDLIALLPLYAAIGVLVSFADSEQTQSEFMIQFIVCLPILFLVGIYGLLRWRSWIRRDRSS